MSPQNVGEAMVANTINTGLFRPQYLLLNNVTLELVEASSQIDHILVTDTSGIFVIETKHYSGCISFGDPQSMRDREWTQVIYKKKSKFHNPVRQNYGHVKALQSLFNLPADVFLFRRRFSQVKQSSKTRTCWAGTF